LEVVDELHAKRGAETGEARKKHVSYAKYW
jgi:hypothetical protein